MQASCQVLVDGDDKNKVEHWTDISESPKDQHWVALFIAGPRSDHPMYIDKFCSITCNNFII